MSITIGNVHRAAGDYATALEMYQQAYDVLETVVGPNHSFTLLAVSNASIAYAAQGDIAKAIEFQARMDQIQEKNIALNVALGTEREKFTYVDARLLPTDRTISLHVRQAPDNRAATELAALVLLQRKGRVLDAVSENMATLRQRLNAADQQLLDKLGATTKQLATLALNGPGTLPADDYRPRLAALETERETLETAISERSAVFRAQAQPVTLAAVKAAIPADAALVEFAALPALQSEGPEDRTPTRTLATWPMSSASRATCAGRRSGRPRMSTRRWRRYAQALRDPTRDDVQQRAREVDRQVMQPRTRAGRRRLTSAHLADRGAQPHSLRSAR